MGSFLFLSPSQNDNIFQRKGAKEAPEENCISLGLQLSLNLKFSSQWKIFAGRDLFIPAIFFALTNRKLHLPDGPVGELLQLTVQRFLDVALRVQIDWRVELLMHQTSLHGGHFRCTCGGVLFLDLLQTTAVRLIICLLLQFDCTQIKQVVVGVEVGLVRDTGRYTTEDRWKNGGTR